MSRTQHTLLPLALALVLAAPARAESPASREALFGLPPTGTAAPEGMRWTPLVSLGEEALPTLMRKVLAAALEAQRGS